MKNPSGCRHQRHRLHPQTHLTCTSSSKQTLPRRGLRLQFPPHGQKHDSCQNHEPLCLEGIFQLTTPHSKASGHELHQRSWRQTHHPLRNRSSEQQANYWQKSLLSSCQTPLPQPLHPEWTSVSMNIPHPAKPCL